ncbi:MAG: T9SS type A sorting domain-containing protein, partial [Bacteroidota bacterium]
HMNDQYGQAGVDMTTTWHCFGDPSLLVRTEAPTPMAVMHPPVLVAGSGFDSLAVLCSRPDALISLTNSSGSVGLSLAGTGPVVFSCPGLNAPDTLWVTVTAFNAQTYVGYVLIIPAGLPYLDTELSGLIETGTQVNGQVDYNESITQDIVVENFGTVDATSVSITISTNDPHINITSPFVQSLPLVAASGSVSLPQAFSYDVANGAPDQHPVIFQINCADGNGSTWSSSSSLIINAPVPAFGPITVNDSLGGNANGLIETGETAILDFTLLNTGHSILPAGSVMITSSLQPLALLCGCTLTHPDVLPGQSVQISCQASLSGNVAIGTTFSVDASLLNTAYPQQASYVLRAGEILEDFETNDFSKFAWSMTGTQPWLITNLQPYQGTACAMSGLINDNETSELNISLLSQADDSVSFHFRTSTESGWDFFQFFVDGVQQGQWSGISPWQYAAFALPAGQHDLRFVYAKDFMISAGDDRVWLDNIRLPFGTTISGLSGTEINSDQTIVYPNPGNGLFRVRATDFIAEAWTITDLVGRIVLSGNASASTGQEIQVDGSRLPSGQYIIGLAGKQGVRQARICVVNP